VHSCLWGLCLGLVAAAAAAVVGYRQHVEIVSRLQEEAEEERRLRQIERTGRIRTQQKQRVAQQEKSGEEGFRLKAIGHIESPFPDRRGTPRQPSLVPAAKGRIRFDKQRIQHEHFAELAEFSHVWVLFIFHENTNTDTIDASPPPAKIKPPRLHGKKVGTLSTRSPHRPNPIGLSWCEIVSVGSDWIEVRGLDLVDKTPVLDVKPYIPYDLVPSHIALPMATNASGAPLLRGARELSVPSWIYESDILLRDVVFSPEASAQLSAAAEQSCVFCDSAVQARELIEQVLRQDVRGVHQGRGNDGDGESGKEFNLRLDGLQIRFLTTKEAINVTSISPSSSS